MCNLLEVGPTLEPTGGFNGVGRNVFGKQGVPYVVEYREMTCEHKEKGPYKMHALPKSISFLFLCMNMSINEIEKINIEISYVHIFIKLSIQL